MKKLIKNTGHIWFFFACLLLATACNDDSKLEEGSSYGFIQLKVQKKAESRGITSGSELNYLKDAKKIQIDLLYNNRQITQTLNLNAVSAEAAEFGLLSESLRLLNGQYVITGYRIYGEYVEGVTPGGTAPILQEGEPDELISFVIEDAKLTMVSLGIEVQKRGELTMVLDKDFSNIQPATKSATVDFQYDKIAFVQVDLKSGLNGTLHEYTFKARRGRNDYLITTDTISLRANSYSAVQLRLLDDKKNVMMVIDKSREIVITDLKLSRDSVGLDMPMTAAYRDYIALYNIWKAMDGENWYWNGIEIPMGANWVFKYSDGTPRPLDLWGKQPGISLGANGRVKSMNIGGFNPKGMVPDAIGELTALETLFLGVHNEIGVIDPNVGTMGINRFELQLKGVDLIKDRLAIAREELKIRHAKKIPSLHSNKKPEAMKYATKYASGETGYSNRITGISEAIGNCKELTMLFVANNLVTDLPASLEDLEYLTDLEIYNTHVKEIPACVTRLKTLVALNFSNNKYLDQSKMTQSLEALFNGPSKKVTQIIYLVDNKLTSLPSNLKNMTNLGLLDLANNKLKSIPKLGQEVALIQFFADFNKLTSIPNGFCKIDDIESFSVTFNELTVFPDIFNSKSVYTIKSIDFGGNKINRFDPGFKGVNVDILNLSFNLFTELPRELSDTESKINFWRISNNQIDTIKPASIEKLRYLLAFECMGNNLEYMPKEFNVEKFPYMNAIDISYNQFRRFPFEVLYVSSLADLRVSNQFDRITGKKTLKEWPENIEKHPALRVLDISANDVKKVRNFPLMLNFLNISDNPNIYITVPQDILYRMMNGSFKLVFDEDQNVSGI